jgi:uncharacterized membrane protein
VHDDLSQNYFCLTDQNTTAFKEVAIIRHPRVGEYAFGFITSNVVLQVLSFDKDLWLYQESVIQKLQVICAIYASCTCFMVFCFVSYYRQTKAMRNCVVFMCQQIIYISVIYFC